MKGRPAQLRPRERGWLDPEPLLALRAELGPQATRRLLDGALDGMAALIERLKRHHARGELADFTRDLGALRQLAEQVGMTGLARAAAAVLICLDRHDTPALAATWARLQRIGERVRAAEDDLRSLAV